jgi:hypothetical protein
MNETGQLQTIKKTNKAKSNALKRWGRGGGSREAGKIKTKYRMKNRNNYICNQQ